MVLCSLYPATFIFVGGLGIQGYEINHTTLATLSLWCLLLGGGALFSHSEGLSTLDCLHLTFSLTLCIFIEENPELERTPGEKHPNSGGLVDAHIPREWSISKQLTTFLNKP